MDVPVANATPIPTLPPAAPQPGPVPQADGASGAAAPAVGPLAGTSPAPAPHFAPTSNQQSDTTLTPVVAKLFNAQQQNVQVSFQVSTDPDEVVTVFTDRSTGKEIIQFPSQALIALAQMYDKDAGKVLDKSV